MSDPQIVALKGFRGHKILWKSAQEGLYLDPGFRYNIKVKMDDRSFSYSLPLNLLLSMS